MASYLQLSRQVRRVFWETSNDEEALVLAYRVYRARGC